jgi:hypothetical protein
MFFFSNLPSYAVIFIKPSYYNFLVDFGHLLATLGYFLVTFWSLLVSYFSIVVGIISTVFTVFSKSNTQLTIYSYGNKFMVKSIEICLTIYAF